MSFLYAFAELRSLPNITLQNSTSCKWSVPQLRAIRTLEIIYDTNNAMTTTTAKSCTCHLSRSWFCLVYYQQGAFFLNWSLFSASTSGFTYDLKQIYWGITLHEILYELTDIFIPSKPSLQNMKHTFSCILHTTCE